MSKYKQYDNSVKKARVDTWIEIQRREAAFKLYELVGDVAVLQSTQIEKYDEYIFELLLQLEKTSEFLKGISKGQEIDEYYLKKNIKNCDKVYNEIQAFKEAFDGDINLKFKKLKKIGDHQQGVYEELMK